MSSRIIFALTEHQGRVLIELAASEPPKWRDYRTLLKLRSRGLVEPFKHWSEAKLTKAGQCAAEVVYSNPDMPWR